MTRGYGGELVNTVDGAGVLFAACLGGPDYEELPGRIAPSMERPLMTAFVPLVTGEEVGDGFNSIEQYHGVIAAAQPVVDRLNYDLLGKEIEVRPDSLVASPPFVNIQLRPSSVLLGARRQLLEVVPDSGFHSDYDHPHGWWAYVGLTSDEEQEIRARLPQTVRITGVVANHYVIADPR